MNIERVFRELGLAVLERGWLSSNNVVFGASAKQPATVVDTGYDSHSAQTVSLVRAVAGAASSIRVVNTHLHSDHCGGNAALQAAWSCETWVPEPSFDAVVRWDRTRLSFDSTGQTCRRFRADRPVVVGELVQLGATLWRVVPAPGHDPDAVMFFQPESKVLISGDALWEDRVAIIFPELSGDGGFESALRALDEIEALGPAIVIPGHGRPFANVGRALAASRQRVAQFKQDPARHRAYATRALVMFHMLEWQVREEAELVAWVLATPIYRQLIAHDDASSARAQAEDVIARLVDSGSLRRSVGMLRVGGAPAR